MFVGVITAVDESWIERVGKYFFVFMLGGLIEQKVDTLVRKDFSIQLLSL